MKTVIAVKRIGKTLPGQTARIPDGMARALVALGHATFPAPEVVPAPVKEVVAPQPRSKRTYQRRDMAPISEVSLRSTQDTPDWPVYVPARIREDDGKA